MKRRLIGSGKSFVGVITTNITGEIEENHTPQPGGERSLCISDGIKKGTSHRYGDTTALCRTRITPYF